MNKGFWDDGVSEGKTLWAFELSPHSLRYHLYPQILSWVTQTAHGKHWYLSRFQPSISVAPCTAPSTYQALKHWPQATNAFWCSWKEKLAQCSPHIGLTLGRPFASGRLLLSPHFLYLSLQTDGSDAAKATRAPPSQLGWEMWGAVIES